jgi:hypothetical protein
VRAQFHMFLAVATLAGALALREMPAAVTSCQASASDSTTATAPAPDWVDAYIAGLEEDDAQGSGLRVGSAERLQAQCDAWAQSSVAARYVRRDLALSRMRAPRDLGDQ